MVNWEAKGCSVNSKGIQPKFASNSTLKRPEFCVNHNSNCNTSES